MKRILIVDDSFTARLVAEKCFSVAYTEKVEVEFAENGQEALSILKKKNIDLIISDINMPVMDGIEFLSELKSISILSKIPCIFVTSMSELNFLGQNSPDFVLTKPINPGSFVSVLEELGFKSEGGTQ